MTTDTDATPSRVEQALARIGATVVRANDDGEIDFSLDGMDGFARERRGRFRASFFLAYDPDRREAEEWAAVHRDVPFAEVQYVTFAGGALLRLLVELPFDEHDHIRRAGQTARAVHAAWLARHQGSSDLLATLGSAGIALPPLGGTALDHVHTYGAWTWGSRYLPPLVLYLFDVEFVARQLVEHGPLFAMAHAGHGINSYGLNLVTTCPSGAVAAYVQHGYGGGYADPVSDLIDINATYSRLHVLWRAADEDPVEAVRWLLAYSQFRGICGVLDLDKVRQGAGSESAFEAYGSESAVFQEMADRLDLSDIDFGTGGNVSW